MMEAGRELDALIAEKVFGLHVYDRHTHETTPISASQILIESWNMSGIPHYSTDIAAAWEVVLELSKSNWIEVYKCSTNPSPPDIRWCCEIGDAEATERTAPHAICLAAPKAIEK